VENKKGMQLANGSGYWEHSPNRWWAVIRKGTMNLLVNVFSTKEEAKEAYESAQFEWDELRRIEREKWEKK
jgi:hypothetical protein